MVSGLLMTTLLLASTIFPPWDQTSQWHQTLPSPVAFPNANPIGVFFALSACAILRKLAVSFGTASKPAAFSMLTRWTSAFPAAPIGRATHFLPSMPYAMHAAYQPPY